MRPPLRAPERAVAPAVGRAVRRAGLTLLLATLSLCAPLVHADPPEPAPSSEPAGAPAAASEAVPAPTSAPARASEARLLDLLPAPLSAVARPLPPLPLEPSQRDKLAFIATLTHRADAVHHFSADPRWRLAMGWSGPAPGELALVPPTDAPDFGLERYPVPLGRRDPAVDLAASVALAWLDARHFSCRFPLRARFLRDRGLAPPGPLPLEAGRCRDFERWARLDEVSSVELVFVAQRWQDLAASMGHVIFRVRRKATRDGAERVVGPSYEAAFSYVAKDPTDTPYYMLKGLTGGLTAGVKLETFGEVWARYSVTEGRDLRLYRLRLSPDELRFLLAEVHAQAGDRMQVPYAFFTTNCATMAYDTLRAVLPDLPERADVLVHPHEVASLVVAHGRADPLGTLPSRETEAREAERARERLAEGLLRLPAFARAHAARWGSPAERAAAWERLTRHLAEHPPAPEHVDALAAWVDATLAIEAFAVDLRAGGHTPGQTSPSLDAALSLRAALPLRAEPAPHRVAALDAGVMPAPEPADHSLKIETSPPTTHAPSGSRRALVYGAVALTAGGEARPGLGWRTSVLDEEVGDARGVSLAPSSRMRLLVNELELGFDLGVGVAVEREQLVLIDSLTLGDGVQTDNGWLGANLGFGFAVDGLSLPRRGLPFALRVMGGPALTLAASRDFAAHLVVQAELRLATWVDEAAAGRAMLRATGGLVLEAGLPLGAPHRLRLRGRLAPGLDLGGASLEASAEALVSFMLDPESGLTFVMSMSYESGLPAGDGARGAAGLAF